MGDVIQAIVDVIVNTVDPEKIILFGSRICDEWSPDSDYDILVLKKGRYRKRELAQRIYRELATVSASVDIIVETPEEAEEYRNIPGLIYGDAMKGRVLYERR